ncbi:MAG TPA: zf-HC2 domain-containing protein [Polyangia bacterium]
MKCADVNEQIVDFLYEEMTTDQRRAFEAHVAGCAACRAEVAAMQATLGLTRAALVAGDEPVPAQVHATAAALVGAAVRSGAAPVRPLGEPIIPEGAGGFWGWLRKPWFFPAFAAAGVMALFLLTRETLLPTAERVGQATNVQAEGAQQKQGPADPAALPPAAPPPAVPAEIPTAEPAAALAEDPAPAAPNAGGDDGDQPSKGATFESRVKRAAKTEAVLDRRLGTTGGGATSGSGLSRLRGPSLSKAKVAAPSPSTASPSSSSPPPSPSAAGEAANLAEATVRAPTSVPVAAPYARGREQRRDPRGGAFADEAPPPTAEPAEAEDDLEVEAGTNEMARAATPRANPTRPAARALARSEDFAKSEQAGAASGAADVTSQAALIDLGARLYAEGRLADAAPVYRDLNKRYPNHPDVEIWKARLEKASAVVKSAPEPANDRPAAKPAPAKPLGR